MNAPRTLDLIEDLRQKPAETSWVEFKENLQDPVSIGKTIAALSNAARIADQHFAYLIWGIRDNDHAVVGTTFQPTSNVISGQPWEFWLAVRFGIDESNKSQVSRIITLALERHLIRAADPDRLRSVDITFWA